MEEIIRLLFGGGILAVTWLEYKNATRYYTNFARIRETEESTIDAILERKTDDFFEFNSLAIKGQAISPIKERPCVAREFKNRLPNHINFLALMPSLATRI